jgi:hypothetical protein
MEVIGGLCANSPAVTKSEKQSVVICRQMGIVKVLSIEANFIEDFAHCSSRANQEARHNTDTTVLLRSAGDRPDRTNDFRLLSKLSLLKSMVPAFNETLKTLETPKV